MQSMHQLIDAFCEAYFDRHDEREAAAVAERLRALSTEEFALEAQMQELLDNLPCGAGIYRLYGEQARVVYLNRRYAELVGREIVTIGKRSGFDSVHPDDAPRMREAVITALNGGGDPSFDLRLLHGDGSYHPYRVTEHLVGREDGTTTIYATFFPISDEEIAFAEMLSVALSAMMASSTDLAFVKDRELRYLCCSRAFARMVGLNNEKDVAGKTDFDLFADRTLAERYRADDLRLIESGESLVDCVEEIPSEDGGLRYSSTSKYLLHDSLGRVIGLYGTGRDITESRTTGARLKLFLDSPPCGIAMFEVTPGGLRSLYFSDGYFNYSGYSRAEYEALVKIRPLYLVYDEDYEALRAAFERLRGDGATLDCLYRCHVRDGGCRWFRMRGTVTERRGETAIVNTVQFDVTEQKEAEEALRVHEQELKLAMSQIGSMLCEYDLATKVLTMPAAYGACYGLGETLFNVPECIFDSGILDEGSLAAYRAFFHAILSGERAGECDLRTRWADGSQHCEHTAFSAITDSNGRTIKAIIAIEDTTLEQERYELERNRPTMGEENLLVHALFNLTTGETLEYAYRDGTPVPRENRVVFPDGREDHLDSLLIDEREREQFRALNDVPTLLARFERGETECAMDYRRRLPGGEIVWVRNILRLLRNPRGNDVLLFEYCYHIEEEKLLELMYRSLASESYDFVARIHGKTGKFRVYQRTDSTYDMPPESGDDANAVVVSLATAYMHPEDRALTIKNLVLDGIRENLLKRDRFELTCREMQDDGSVRYKKLTGYYLDRPREIIIVTREDVSELVRAEMEKNDALAAALAAANQASRAKSQFLSRMSHELRTPMNAIIGLSALAASDVGDPAAMEDAITKIGISARYLLSLINDILEMSRIESGRMTLNEGPFDFEQLVSDVNTIIYRQSCDKGVDYDAIVNGFTESVYVGDATKLQQILINILGNAVKFTGAGGKVTLAIEQLRRASNRATLRFTISDTGCGIDEAFLPHIFDAFSQEGSSYTSASNGTGLGLAITKNMVEMMNGHIGVQSIKGIGSVFTIEVQLGIPEESRRYLDMVSAMNLHSLSALVVDDDVVVCRSTKNILSNMGMRAEWVDSGRAAVERVEQAHAGHEDFDTVFIDWKMPDMDGIETTRRIRKIVGPDVTIVIMTAYDYRAIEAQAREAGVDLFMEKPLFQSSIISAFEKIFSARRDKIEPAPVQRYDFTGRRILLAEDHPLNVEVARRLLEKAHAEVVVVNNGLEALEAFTTAPTDYFDAILMDIRMPVMDGLTASNSIRNLKKEGSRTIPIIAMTANAFDEDVEQSLSHGMDAHLIKPIDPMLLYATLQKLMRR